MLNKIVINILVSSTTASSSLPFLFIGPLFNLIKSRIARDRSTLLTNHFESIVLGRIMASSNHTATVETIKSRSKVNHFSAHQTEVNHINTSIIQPTSKSIIEFGTTQPNIVTNTYRRGIEFISIRPSNSIGEFRIQLRWNYSPNVVRFKCWKILSHCKPT